MTGFGCSQIDINKNEIISIEIRSFNNKFLDIKMNVLEEYKNLEKNIRNLITTNISRGKIEIKISKQSNDILEDYSFHAFINNISNKMLFIKKEIPDIRPPTSAELINLFYKNKNNVINSSCPLNENLVIESIILAINNLKEDREREGEALCKIIINYTNNIGKIIKHIEQNAQLSIESFKNKLLKKIEKNFIGVLSNKFDEIDDQEIKDKFIQEIIANVLKVDISEEIDRLNIHLKEMYRTVNEQKCNIGKKIEYLTQEMNREINTIGSKTNTTEISHLAIEIKLLIDKIREQSQNIE
ncbi:YicC-like stress response protein [Candidatus Kinetoplastibacterium crithidii TCC036E]|uniref:YicC-like stress response protein n=2 Tax=Candidatus Kinetoplastidibacterium crithidiae TaxID=33056 RepID=M1M651_9PROT|nr:hypothetical protein CKCE_0315 [Candidatus Kinetoplastibacterium crithidii (ex Angomonas deanei ATCC 30255)]AGF47600.1 YicC-like stress response protein [Candidatus Kinetoplastibacterium crithidii TCC036E]